MMPKCEWCFVLFVLKKALFTRENDLSVPRAFVSPLMECVLTRTSEDLYSGPYPVARSGHVVLIDAPNVLVLKARPFVQTIASFENRICHNGNGHNKKHQQRDGI